MKKIILTLIAVVAMSATSMAQGNGNRRQMGGQGFNPAEMIQRRTDQMGKQYKLNDEQAAALKALNEKFMGQNAQRGQRGERPQMQNGQRGERPQMNDSVRAQRGNRGQRNAQGGGQNGQRGNRMGQGGQRGFGGGFGFNNEEYTNELKKIFTEEQFKAYEKDQKDMQARFQNMRNGGNRRQGGGFGGGNNGFGGDNGFQNGGGGFDD